MAGCNSEDKNSEIKIRSPVCTIVGHVDHGKTKILDRIRGTAVASGEAGGITQAIGASIIPIHIVKKVCGDILAKMKINLTIPGLLFIDTPGHAAFTNLRKRGGNLADIAVIVIDIREGPKPQTLEALEILRGYKTPFVIALNKIDLLNGWHPNENMSLLEDIKLQRDSTAAILDNSLYKIVGWLSEHGISSERFDRVEDFTKQICIIPTSATTGEGIAELLVMISGLAQRYLENCLKCNLAGCAKGTVLEVKEEIGLGATIDVILYDGKLKVGDNIIIGGIDRPIVTKVKALFEPKPLQEMRDKKAKFSPVKEVFAATGVKISAPELCEVVAGMPLRGFIPAEQKIVEDEVMREVAEVIIATDDDGVIIKADTLGSLEALIKLLKDKNISIRKATVGDINKKDVSDAEAQGEKNPLNAVVLGFNVDVSNDAEEHSKQKRIEVITNMVIYKLIEHFEKWVVDEKKRIEQKNLETVTRPSKVQLIHGYVFRQCSPAIVGADIIAGNLKTGTNLMNLQGKNIGFVKSIQLEKESISIAEEGKQVALAIEGPIIGRQLQDNETLFASISEEHFRKLKEFKQLLTRTELAVMKEYADIKRKDSPVWGV